MVVFFCRLRELDDDEETLGHAFSLNDAWVQFELPGDVDDNGVSSSIRLSLPPAPLKGSDCRFSKHSFLFHFYIHVVSVTISKTRPPRP